MEDTRPLIEAPAAPQDPPTPRYEITIVQRGERVTTEITLPHDTARTRATKRARAALLDHAPGSEVTVHHIPAADTRTLVWHRQLDARRQIVAP
jgi:hypothetical protein